jgi:peptidoglycan-N-acetylglucosamine deacetylase
MSRYFVVNAVFIVLLVPLLLVEGLGILHVPVIGYILVVVTYLVIMTAGTVILSWQFFIPVKSSGISQQSIAITFDDGPMEGKTEKILEILRKQNIPGAFFCIGNRVDKNPALVKRIHDEGHLIGNHSYWHAATFDLQRAATITQELMDTDTSIYNVIGKKPKFFRPPYGVTNPMVSRAVRQNNYTVIGWSVRSFDTVIKDPQKLFRRITRSLKGGDIVLFHDYSESTLEILPVFLQHVNALGLKIVRVDELLNEKAYG